MGQSRGARWGICERSERLEPSIQRKSKAIPSIPLLRKGKDNLEDPTPHRSRLAGFIIDCNTDDLDAAADFWSQALGCSIADRGAGDDTAQYQTFGNTPGELHIEVQKVSHPSRVHLDIEADDIDAEADRLEKLGAKRIGFVKRWWVMEAPTGQRFCVVRMKHPEKGAAPTVWNE